MKNMLFTGSYGFVIKPDTKTQLHAERHAKELFPLAEYRVTVPHITLYHGKVINLPATLVVDILKQLRVYRGERLKLFRVDVYGSKFAFWDAEIVECLSLMHQYSLGISKYLDLSAVQRSVEEGLDMSPGELENVKKYGHPLVNDKYRPHITLAYDSNGLAVKPELKLKVQEAVVADILFAEMGRFGSVARVLN